MKIPKMGLFGRRKSTRSQTATSTSDEPAEGPQDIASPTTTAETIDPGFRPTRAYFIASHTGLTRDVPIFDISSAVDLANYASTGSSREAWGRTAHTIGRAQQIDARATPLLLIRRNKWYGHNFTAVRGGATRGSDGEYPAADLVAEWKGGWYSGAKNRLEFPAASAHSSHTITMATGSYVAFRDGFVVDSASFEWRCLNQFSMRRFRLDRVIGGERTTAAMAWKPRSQIWHQGGVLVVDAEQVDEVVAVLTGMVMLRKQRQKTYEYSG
jgi:hypothetical protein